VGGIKLQELQYLKPRTINEALEMLDKYGKDAKILAGGTDLIIALKDRMIMCKYLIDIKAIKEIQNISYSEVDGLSIGSAVCLNDIIESKYIKDNYSILGQAGKTLANKLLRNRATLTGNVCNSSPGGDMLPASLVLDGKVEIASSAGNRVIPLKEFITGVKKNVLKEKELVTRILFPKIEGKGIYLKRSRIKGHDLAQISVAAYLTKDGTFKAAVGAAGPTPVLIEKFRRYGKLELHSNKAEIVKTILSEVSPIDDVRATKAYRLVMIEYLINHIIEELEGAV
jgi:CO/xanthine dehydrogenase FAD-binding subunit